VTWQDWPELGSHIVICIESLELAPSVRQEAAIQTVFVMYNFLPDFCQSAQEQCTEALATAQGTIKYNHAVVRHTTHYHLLLTFCVSRIGFGSVIVLPHVETT